jgi:hypothetical protein
VGYGLLITGIAALIVVVVFAFGGKLTGMYSQHRRGRHERHNLLSGACGRARWVPWSEVHRGADQHVADE